MRLVSLSDLKVGDTIARAVTDDYGRVLVEAGVVVKNRGLISRLKEQKIIGVYINDEWSADIFVNPLISQEVVYNTITALKEMNIEGVFSSASDIVDSLLSSNQLYNDMQSLKYYDEYTYNHSINVAIFATTFAIGLDYNYKRLKNIASGALLHDIGKKMIPIEIINKEGKLSKDEIKIVKKHSENGYKILCQNDAITSSIREIAHQHHENWDGTGYPRKLKGNKIYELAHVVHICDVYDALISKRSYKSAYSTLKAVKILMNGRETLFNPELLDEFFKYVPVYAKGMKVKLSDGQDALIYENNRGDMLNPTVITRDKELIDLRCSYLSITN